MAVESPPRYICFCGLTIIGATVCPDCAKEMASALLRAAAARTARRGDGEPVAELAGAGTVAS